MTARCFEKILKTRQLIPNSLIKGVSESIAYNGGSYSLDLTPPGGPVLKEKGNYSLVWSKQQDGDWKLALIHIEDLTRMPDIN